MKIDPVQDRTRCKAKTRSGRRCKNPPILAGTVCRMHGGSAPQVKEAAQRRLVAMILPALAELHDVLRKPDTSDADRLRAIKEVLDRGGVSAKLTVEVEAPWQSIIDGIVAEVDDAALAVPTPEREPEAEVLDAELVEDDEPAALPTPAATVVALPAGKRRRSTDAPKYIRDRLLGDDGSNASWSQ